MFLYLDLVYQWEEGQVGQKYGDEAATGGQASCQGSDDGKNFFVRTAKNDFFITVSRLCWQLVWRATTQRWPNFCDKQCLTQNWSKKLNFLDWRWCASGQVIRKKYEKKIFCILKFSEERSRSRVGSGSGSISQRYGSGDPDPHQNATDPQHWWQELPCLISCGESYSAWTPLARTPLSELLWSL